METRLGDIIDDFCVKCKRIMNHAVVSILDGKPAKVRCRTCYNDHDYRHEQAPPPKVDPRKLALLAEKAAKAAADASAAGDAVAEEAVVNAAVVEDAVVEEAAVPTVKAKARGRK
jgi:hypothetical protein